MSHRARWCRACGQPFHGRGLWDVCPGCRAEKKLRRRERRMMSDYEPASGDNLPPGCMEAGDAGDGPARCRDCGEWEPCPCGCGYGWCRLDGDFMEGGESC